MSIDYTLFYTVYIIYKQTIYIIYNKYFHSIMSPVNKHVRILYININIEYRI